MNTLIFLIVAAIMRKSKGAVIALLIATFIDVSSIGLFYVMGNAKPMYVYYVVLFLLMFSWWIATGKLKLITSQIVAGLACAFSSVLVLDCYFSGGYETVLSIADPYIFTLINIATVWAAFNDRDWTYSTNRINRVHDIKEHNKVDTRC